MMWRPVTAGEVVFQHLYKSIGQHIEVTNEIHGLDYLLSEARFREFVKLSATLEVFMRAIRCVCETYFEIPDGTPREFGRRLRLEIDLPNVEIRDAAFCESLKQAGRIASEKRAATAALKKIVLRDGSNRCYLCDINLTSLKDRDNTATIDHIWPLALAGQSSEENLIAACCDCNTKKDLYATWAWGPVQNTYHQINDPGKKAHWNIRISLALARLMWAASHGPGLKTLKQAAQQIWPAFPKLEMKVNRPYLFFELLHECEERA